MKEQILTSNVKVNEVSLNKLYLASAFLLGLVILYSVGFVQAPLAHSIAHDVRHSQGFPCH
jgi:cobalt transporter subunit CbtB